MEAGISVADLAKTAGITPGYIYHLELGRRFAAISGEISLRIAKALGVELEWLLHGKGRRSAA